MSTLSRLNDPICAPATPLGRGGISVIRVSGLSIFKRCKPLFTGIDLSVAEGNRVYFGHWLNSDGIAIDEVLVTVFHNPRSYTGEDVLEISSHCNRIIVERIIESLTDHHIRIADPGEFTKRAFINGKLDLSQAEAVADLIEAGNHYAADNAFHILQGRLSQIVADMRDDLIQTAGLLEIDLDFSEEDLDIVDVEAVNQRLMQIISNMNAFLKRSDELRFINDGIRLCIVGQPNAGKSSLLNVLLGRDRAIVSDIAGTTRDTIEELINWDELTVRLIDTAGIRQTTDQIEKIGVDYAYQTIDQADCVVLVVDSQAGYQEDDHLILKYAIAQEKRVIVALNKTDLTAAPDIDHPHTVAISAKDESGIDELKSMIITVYQANTIREDESIVVTNLRHDAVIRRAILNLERAQEAIKQNLGNPMIAADIREAIDELGEITGEISNTDILNRIFSSFCIGK